jgi:hypothetical protein
MNEGSADHNEIEKVYQIEESPQSYSTCKVYGVLPR